MKCRQCNRDVTGIGHVCPECRRLAESMQELPVWLKIVLVVVAFAVPVGTVLRLIVLRIGGQ